MSEKHPTSAERHHVSTEHTQRNEVKKHNSHERAKAATHEHKQNLESIKAKIEQEAVSGKERPQSEKEKPTPSQTHYVPDKHLQGLAFDRTIQHVRKRLSPNEKRLSKAIHQPVVERVSEITAKTVARPSGIMTGSACALIGSIILLWASRHYGFSYNYLIALLLLVSGYVLGCTLELIYLALRRLRSENQ